MVEGDLGKWLQREVLEYTGGSRRDLGESSEPG